MTRKVKEWIGKSDDAKVPDAVRLRIWRRQCQENGDSNFAICPLSGAPMRGPHKKDLDHEKALIDGGQHRESNLRFVLVRAHKAKTAEEVARRAKNDDRAKKNAQVMNEQPKIQGKPMPKTPKAAAREEKRTKPKYVCRPPFQMYVPK